MKRVMQLTAGAVFAMIDYWGPAYSQQPNAPELFRPAVCDELNVDGRASTSLRVVALPPSQRLHNPSQQWLPYPGPQLHSWSDQSHTDD